MTLKIVVPGTEKDVHKLGVVSCTCSLGSCTI